MPTPDPAARAEIADLLAGYSFGYDLQEWPVYRAIWADDAELVTPNGAWRGPAGIEEHARAWRGQLAARGIQTRHYQTNTLYGEVGSDRITARTMFHVLWQHTGRPAPEPVHSGEYRDVFVRTAQGWRLASRSVVVDHD